MAFVAVAAVVGAMVAIKLSGSGGGSTPAADVVSTTALGQVASAPIAGVPSVTGVRSPGRVAAGLPALTKDGKPEVLYLGAEYCPYCAAERWPFIVAMSRFGTFSGLRESHSSPTDVYPNTPTVTFAGSTYRSDYLSFVGIESADIDGKPLQTVTPEQKALAQRISGNQGIPFIDFGNAYYTSGASYAPDVLKGLSFDGIAASLAKPGSTAGGPVLDTANRMTAALCELTGDRPAKVCATPEIDALQRQLGG